MSATTSFRVSGRLVTSGPANRMQVEGAYVAPFRALTRAAERCKLTDGTTERFLGISLSGGDEDAFVDVQTSGPIDATRGSLGAGTAEDVGCKTDGTPCRRSDPDCTSGSNILGWCDTTGAIYVAPGTKGDTGAPGDAVERPTSTATVATRAAVLDPAQAGKLRSVVDPPTRRIVGVFTETAIAGAAQVVQNSGPIDPAVKNLGAGVAAAVGTDASGNLVRVTDATCRSDLNFVGWCDEAGTITVAPTLERVTNVLDWGLDPTGLTACDAAIATLLTRLDTDYRHSQSVHFPPGVYRFNSPFPRIPTGVKIVGDGVASGSNPRLYSGAGTILAYFGSGSFITFDLSGDATNFSHRGGVENLSILSGNTNGEASWPDVAESAVKVLGDAQLVFDRLQIGGFKYGLDLDGAELVWASRIGFDGGQFNIVQPDGSHITYSGYPDTQTNRDAIALAFSGTLVITGGPRDDLTDLPQTIQRTDGGSFITDGFRPGATITISGTASNNRSLRIKRVSASKLHVADAWNTPLVTETAAGTLSGTVFDSACAYRMGDFAFDVSGSANVLYLDQCQFNGQRWGGWHKGGISQGVTRCNYELPGGMAWVEGGIQLFFVDDTSEGYGGAGGVAGFRVPEGGQVIGMTVERCFFGGSRKPAILNDGTITNLAFVRNSAYACFSTTGFYPLDGDGFWQDVVHFGNSLPPERPILCSKYFGTTSFAAKGTPINHGTDVIAALDVVTLDYLVKLLALRSADHVYYDWGNTAFNGGIVTRNRRVYSTDTAQPVASDLASCEWGKLAAAGAAIDLGATDVITTTAGVVEIEVIGNSTANDGHTGRWVIEQAFRREGGTTILLGSPTTIRSFDLDGSFVAPTIAVTSSTKLGANVSSHPTLATNWTAFVRVKTTGR